MKSTFYFLSIGYLFLMLNSCGNDTKVENEEELITTLTYILTPSNGGASTTLIFRDLDGDGPKAPTITSPSLKVNTSYTGLIQLTDESKSPAEDITAEVLEEADEHQFFFVTDAATVTYTDTDKDGKPLGLKSSLVTTTAKTGTLKITLRHLPIKSASGVSDGKIANAGGETDVEVTFPITIAQ